MPTQGFAHTKVKKSIFKSKILEFVGYMDIIWNDYQCLFYSFIYNKVEKPKIPGIQPT